MISNASRVWQCTFQTVADLDEHFAVLSENKQDDTVALLFLSDAPGLRDTLRVSGNVVIALHFRINGDDNLVRSVAFELRELFVETQRRCLSKQLRRYLGSNPAVSAE